MVYLCLVMAATWNLDVNGLKKLTQVSKGIEIKLTPIVEQVIDNNAVRLRALQKRKPALRRQPKDKTSVPGHTLMLDVWIPTPGTTCPVTGATSQIEVIDACTSTGVPFNVKAHKLEQFKTSVSTVIVYLEAKGITPKLVVVDADSVARGDDLRPWLASIGLSSRMAAGGRHELIGLLEATGGDVIERRAEMMTARLAATLGTDKVANWILAARTYAWWLRNRGAVAGREHSPLHALLGEPFDLRKYNKRGGLPIFGSLVSYLLDGAQRGAKGGLESRSAEGRFCYMSEIDDVYVLCSRHERLITRHAVTALYQAEMARVGLGPGAAAVEVTTQITPDDAPPLQLMLPPPVRQPAQQVKVVTKIEDDTMPIGASCRHWWRNAKGDGGSWYDGTVVDIKDGPSGEVHHVIKYDGWKGVYTHDLAADREWGRLPWVRVKPTTSQQPPPPPPPPPPPRPPLRTTRHSAGVRVARVYAAAAMDKCSSEYANEIAAQVMYQLGGEAADGFEPASVDEIEDALDSFETYMAKAEFKVMKAKQREVVVNTPMGETTITVPTTTKQVMQDKNKEQWIRADRKALEVSILAFDGNSLVPWKGQQDVAEPVVERRYKTEVVEGKLVPAANDAFKSRIAWDEVRVARRRAKANIFDPTPTYSTSAGPITKRWTLARAARLGHTVVKGDCSNAYARADSQGGARHMRVPEHLREYDEEGNELIIEFASHPTWGQPPAGFLWDEKFDGVKLKVGWSRAEGVPGQWTFGTQHGVMVLVGEVDDFIVTEPPQSNYYQSALAIYLFDQHLRQGDELKARIAETPTIKWQAEPEVYAGWELARSDDLKRLTLRMTNKVVDFCNEFVPEVVEGDKAKIAAAKYLRGKELRDALDALALAGVSGSGVAAGLGQRLSPEGKEFQRLNGKMRFPVELFPRYEHAMNHMARVSSRPEDGALHVAKSLAADWYEHRHEGITYSGTDDSDVWRPRVAIKGELRQRGDGFDEGHGGASGVKLASGAPAKMEGHADATWSKMSAAGKPADVIGMLATAAKAALVTKCKSVKLVPESSMDVERIASCRITEIIEFLAHHDSAVGEGGEPALVTTDNKANQLVAGGEGSAMRARHALRRYVILQQRIAEGYCVLRHVEDAENPADFLTKWVSAKKLIESLEYVTNSKEAVEATSKELLASSKAAMLAALEKIATKHAIEKLTE